MLLPLQVVTAALAHWEQAHSLLEQQEQEQEQAHSVV